MRALPALTPRWRRALAVATVIASILIIVWDHSPLSYRATLDPGRIDHREGMAYTVPLPAANWFFGPAPDTVSDADASSLELLEDGEELGPAHTIHKTIVTTGKGAFSHWGRGLVFSARDGGDPRTNGRRYEARYEVTPSSWLVAVAWLTLLAAIGAAILRPVVARLQATRVGAHTVSILVVAALFALAVLATLTAWVPIPGGFSVVAKGAQTLEQTGDFDTGSRTGLVRFITFERLVAPFLIVPSPREGQPSPYVRVSLEKSRLREVMSTGEWQDAGDAVFLDSDRIGGDTLVVYVPKGLAREPATLKVTYLARVTPGALGALWGVFAIAALAALVARALASRPAPVRRILVTAATLALAAVALALLNLVGLTAPPRDLETQYSSPNPPSGWFHADWLARHEELERRMQPRSGEAGADYARRVNDLVYFYVSHAWNYANASRYELHVPPWENYLLWALGELDVRFYRYHYAAWRPALERGAGMCSQVSLALVAILREHSFDARVVQLAGHTVVTAEVAPGKWHILDPDNGITIPASLDTIERDPEIVRGLYESGLERNGQPDAKFYANVMVRFYGKDGNHVEPRGGNEMLGEAWAIRENIAEWLKWGLPALLLVLAAALAGAARASARPRRLN